ncbi:MAG TPA: tetratricopeptide repeat protein [Candidatus Sulfotelmatobacter sp.]|nr:tetratricopeptide repeat protein [Candidatus Sulfotelmatobacter sp.]
MSLGLSGRGLGQSQTFDVGGNSGNSSKKQTSSKPASGQSSSDFSWGAGIEVARQARAADEALKRNDYAAAVAFAQQAARSAPQDAEIWFLLGYAARLNEKYPLSIDSYNHGLKLRPDSIKGLAGLAQTYARMGRTQEAEQLLKKVVQANPKDANSLQLAGELLLSTDPQASLSFLQRADAVQPSAHTDLLMAHAYDRLGQRDESAKFLDKAKQRAPHDPEVLRAVAGQYRDQGKYDEAIATLQAIPNKNADTEAELAYTYQAAGRQQDAANLYSQLAKRAKGNIGLGLSAAQAWVNLGRPEDAKPFLDAARQIDANSYRLHAILGSIAEGEERMPEAEQEYKLALNNLPAVPQEGPLYPIELRLNLYEVYVREENDAAAKQQLQQASAAIQQAQVPDIERPELLRLRAAVEAASGNYDAANRDLKEALALAPSNVNSLMNFGMLQWKLGQKDAARDTFTKVLDIDKNNRQALSALGYLARDAGNTKLAESFFARAIAAHPKDYAPYLALGDLYTAERKFRAAQTNYEAAYDRMPTNALVVAGGANAAIESHNIDLAQHWLERANDKMNTSPQVERERERYLTFKGNFAESAKLGYKVLEKLPNDREGVDYLAYDLYNLGQYDDALALAKKYEPVLPKDKDLPLIAGNVYSHNGDREAALESYTKALELDPKMATGYVDRGFILNDLKQAPKATTDFETALRLQPGYGEAHLGLAYSYLQLHRAKPALKQLEAAEKILGKSHSTHLARAEAFRQESDYPRAAAEYRIALSEDPKDLTTELAYADVLYRMRKYDEATAALKTALSISPSDPAIYALMAQIDAKQGKREDALRDIASAERLGGDRIEILTATGDAFLTLGDRDAAMQRFARALDVPGGNRIAVRMAIAQIFMRQGHPDEARRQIALGFAEARMFPDSPVTGQDYADAGNLFLAMHDFDLAENYFAKAQLAGANSRVVAIGLTNTYLAEGNTQKAAASLASLGPAADYSGDYDYMMASANLYRQRQDPLHSLAAFAQATTVAGVEDHGIAEMSQYTEAEQEGRQLNDKISFVPEGSFAPALEDINVYQTDARILRVTDPKLLPPPRSNFQDLVQTHYRVKLGNLPVISGFVGQSLTVGRFLFPSIGVIQDRNTYDTILNGGINPILHLGTNTITFNGGVQFTLRRDAVSPIYMSQNLFKQFLYVYTSSFFNWVSITGSAEREAGPFVDQTLHSRDLFGNIEFTVGRPWGSNSLITGYSARDLLFNPLVEEYFNTSIYGGIQHKFGSRLTAAILAEDLRSWRVENTRYAIAQALLPGGRFDFRATPRWSVQGEVVFSRGAGFHAYDNVESQFLVSYVRPLRGSVHDGMGETPVSFPIRFSLGVEQQTFYDFPGSSRSTILPIVHLTLF